MDKNELLDKQKKLLEKIKDATDERDYQDSLIYKYEKELRQVEQELDDFPS